MSHKQPLISVLIPVYNVEQYLRQCLDSVISQTLRDIEIICVNDGSTDSSLQILQEYAERDKRIQTISKEKNEGLILARKTGVLASTGKYICFLDSDDWLTGNGSLQAMVGAIEAEQVDMLMFPVAFSAGSGGIEIKNYKKHFNHVSQSITGTQSIIRYWYETFFWYIWPKVYRAEVCKKAFAEIEDRYFVMWEDVYGTFMLSYFTKTFKCIQLKPLITYRLGTGISTKRRFEMKDFNQFINAFELLECLKRFLSKENQLENYQEIINRLYYRFSESAFKTLYKLKTKDLRKAFAELTRYCDLTEFLKGFSKKKYKRYKFLSKVTFGETHKRYVRKVKEQQVVKFLKNNAKNWSIDILHAKGAQS